MDALPDADGLVTLASRHDFQTTLDRLIETLNARGVAIFAVIDHAAGARDAGLALAPTTVVLFGDPRAGTPLMQAAPLAGIDLPLKILVWADASGSTWLTCYDPAWIARRHAVDPEKLPTIGKMTAATLQSAVAAGGA